MAKTQFKNMWVMVLGNHIDTSSVRYQRKTCILHFVNEYANKTIDWNYLKKNGWRCEKVNVNFEFLTLK